MCVMTFASIGYDILVLAVRVGLDGLVGLGEVQDYRLRPWVTGF